jgi:hypothetical protein
MIKGLLWRIGFELANLWRLLFPGKHRVKYFAFGANMDPRILAKRLIIPLEIQDFVLDDHALGFTTPGPYEGMGFASVEGQAGAKAYGRLYTLRATDARRLDYYEMVPIFGYYRRVWLEQGGDRFFFYQSTMPESGLRPTVTYLEKLCNGYSCAAHVPPEYVESIRRHEVLVERRFNPKLQFSFPISERLPEVVVRALRAYDRRAVSFFMKYLLETSLLERFLRGKSDPGCAE